VNARSRSKRTITRPISKMTALGVRSTGWRAGEARGASFPGLLLCRRTKRESFRF
jgi:hypothetical protein